MFSKEKNDSTAQHLANEKRDGLYMLIRSYIEHECRLSKTFTRRQDLEQEVQNRLAKIFS